MSKFHCGRVSSIELAFASPVILCRLLNPKHSSWIYLSLSTKRRTSDSQFIYPYNIVTCDRACDAFLNWFSFVFLQKRKSRFVEFRRGVSILFSSWNNIHFHNPKGGFQNPWNPPLATPLISCDSSSMKTNILLDFARFTKLLSLPEKINDGHVAALVRSQMNALKPFGRTIEQATETMPLALKQ